MVGLNFFDGIEKVNLDNPRKDKGGAAHAAYTSGGGAWVPRHLAGRG